VRTIEPLGKEVHEASDRYVVLVRPLAADDFTWTEVHYESPDLSLKSVWARQDCALHPELYAHIDAADVMPLVPYDGKKRREYWRASIVGHYDYRGCRTHEQRERRMQQAVEALRARVEKGELRDVLVNGANAEIETDVRQHQYRYVEETTRRLLRGVSEEWFAEHAGTTPMHERMEALRAQIEPLERELAQIERNMQVAKCDALLKALDEEGWHNSAGDPLPLEVKEAVRPVLVEHKAYGEHRLPRGLRRMVG